MQNLAFFQPTFFEPLIAPLFRMAASDKKRRSRSLFWLALFLLRIPLDLEAPVW
jgi:hypothetical protein